MVAITVNKCILKLNELIILIDGNQPFEEIAKVNALLKDLIEYSNGGEDR